MGSTLSLKVPLQSVHTTIVVEKGLLRRQEWFERVKEVSTRIALITDERVRTLFGKSLSEKLKQAGFDTTLLSFPPGESSKTREWKEILEEGMIEEGFGRDTAVIALGGGVVTDLAGFVASTYCRGIPLISIPTTLMGMIDASIGGKVGVNTLRGKNRIGAFHHPHYVFADPETLATLPQGEILNGLGEVIKYALVTSPSLFEHLQNQKPIDEERIRLCCTIKRDVVEKDPQEKGVRRILNFGHTVGHALEAAALYSMPHGTAVAFGMMAEAFLSCRLGYLSEKNLEKIVALIKTYGFQMSPPVSKEDYLAHLRYDKKGVASQPRCVLLQDIGKVVPFDGAYCCTLSSRDWEEAFHWVIAHGK